MTRPTRLLLAFGLVSCKDALTAPPVATIPAKLAFTVQPSHTTAGAAISPAMAVTVQDAAGNTVTTATTSITVAIGTNPGGGTLAGTTTASAVNGVARFADPSINNPGTGYTLTASASGLNGATSVLFNVTGILNPRTLDVNGVWDWTQRFEYVESHDVCSDTGSYTFAQTPSRVWQNR